jgi:hypothetical protein
MTYGKSIELFLVNGTADSLITAELSNWNGKAIKIPRIEIPKCDREEITHAGAYFLFGQDEDGSDSVYIGESENIKDRLMQHIKNDTFEWNTAVVFIGRDLNKTLIRYLENRLVQIAKTSARYKVITKNTYQNTVMKESQISEMDEFIENVKILINALGYKVLEPYLFDANNSTSIDDELLYISTGSAHAVGKATAEGFVVLQGGVINEKLSVRSVSTSTVKLRERYLNNGKVKGMTITENILFTSSSAAADFVLGYSVSGPRTWKTQDGRTLKDLENSEID